MKKVVSLFLAVIMIFSFAACSAAKEEQTGDTSDNRKDVNAYVLSGPTGIGAVNLMSRAEKGEGQENYTFTVVAAPDEVVSKISNGEADIAAIPTNLASSLYNKTEGGVKILAVNTLGVLYVLNNKGAEIKSLSDLKGRTVYTTGQGSNPQYIIEYLLDKNSIDAQKDVKIEYKAEGSELVPVWATDPEAVIIAPQPVASTITAKYEGSVQSLDLTEEWEKLSDGSSLMMGCVVARSEFVEENPDAVSAFLVDYYQSITAAENDVEGTAALCEQYGIVASAAIAKAAIPYCNICCITGSEMKEKLTGYLQVLYDANPKSIGGAMPGEDFWY